MTFEFNLFGEKIEDVEEKKQKEKKKSTNTKNTAAKKKEQKTSTQRKKTVSTKEKQLPKDRPLLVCYAREQIEFSLEERADIQEEAKKQKVDELEIVRRQLNRIFPELSAERVTWHWEEEETREEVMKRAESKVDALFKAKREKDEFKPLDIENSKILVQASENNQCTPRANLDTLGEYEEVEITLNGEGIAIPEDAENELAEYRDGETNNYCNVPADIAKKALVQIVAGPEPEKEKGPVVIVPVITAGKKGC